MTCINCGKFNDNESNYCKYCGTDLHINSTNPHRTIFENRYLQSKANTELGYLIIAILMLLNVFMWVSWKFLSDAGMIGNNSLFKGLRVFTFTFSIAQFVVMFMFSKRQSFKIAIGIIAGIVILFDFYFLIKMLR